MTRLSRRGLLAGGLGLAATGVLSRSAGAAPPVDRFSAAVLRSWAADTWASLVAMTDRDTGLTADNVRASIRRPVRSGYTSPTNVGGYLWSTVVARDLRLISPRECSARIRLTLRTLASLPRHLPSGQFYNWYDETDGSVLTTWPVDGSRVYPFMSSVDNGWLAAALIVVRNADPVNSARAGRLLESMKFQVYFNQAAGVGGAGLLKGGFWDGESKPGEAVVLDNYLEPGGPPLKYTGFHYDTTVSETRIASYIGIARGQIPERHYFATYRTLPPTGFTWQEQRPIGSIARYEGIDVFEGAYPYRGMLLVPGWGGSMFEALMPNMFVPEERWAPRSWGVNHPLTVRAHREHGLLDARYGYWGFSPASDPAAYDPERKDWGYREYGVDAIGMKQDGYFSDVQKTDYDVGYRAVPPEEDRPATNPNPNYGDGVVTPHALFLAMHHEPQQAYENLRRLQRRHYAYGQGGFYDAVAVDSGRVARRYLSLDQAMVLGSIGNVIGGGIVRRAFCAGEIERRIRPLIAQETFGAAPS